MKAAYTPILGLALALLGGTAAPAATVTQTESHAFALFGAQTDTVETYVFAPFSGTGTLTGFQLGLGSLLFLSATGGAASAAVGWTLDGTGVIDTASTAASGSMVVTPVIDLFTAFDPLAGATLKLTYSAAVNSSSLAFYGGIATVTYISEVDDAVPPPDTAGSPSLTAVALPASLPLGAAAIAGLALAGRGRRRRRRPFAT